MERERERTGCSTSTALEALAVMGSWAVGAMAWVDGIFDCSCQPPIFLPVSVASWVSYIVLIDGEKWWVGEFKSCC